MHLFRSPAGIAVLIWTLVPAILVLTRPELVGLTPDACVSAPEVSSRLSAIEARLDQLAAQRDGASLRGAPNAAGRASAVPPQGRTPEAASPAKAKAQDTRED